MKVLLAGAFGHLGSDVLRSLVENGHEVIAVDAVIKEMDFDGYTPLQIDMTNKEKLKDCCKDVDVVITTVGLTKASEKVTPYDIDYGANKNLLDEAIHSKVKHFVYISVLKADKGRHIPMLDAKAMFEEELRKSNLSYTIFRPTGYFYDTAHIFEPKVEKGIVTLLKTKEEIKCNVIDTRDFAEYIVEHMCDDKKEYDVGGTEVYTYEEIAEMFFKEAGKTPVIKYVPPFLFDRIILFSPKWKRGVIQFGKWTMTEDMVASVKTGKRSFKEYIHEIYEKGLKF